MSDWQPSASILALQARAALNQTLRAFFQKRNVLEVETPLLMRATAAETHLKNFSFGDYALQTSPESAMKRLVCAGSGPIYQLGKAFRAEEQGRRHNPEFTMLEWYQPDYSFEQMIQETVSLIRQVLPQRETTAQSYRAVFETHTGLNPHQCSDKQLADYATRHIDGYFDDMSRSDWLDLIMSQCIEPKFEATKLTIITDFPACQAALAKTVNDIHGAVVAKRFEIYCGGLELANGYDELCDPIPLAKVLAGNDEAMLAAFKASAIKRCCGVALGVDRLLMLQQQTTNIASVLAFSFERS